MTYKISDLDGVLVFVLAFKLYFPSSRLVSGSGEVCHSSGYGSTLKEFNVAPYPALWQISPPLLMYRSHFFYIFLTKQSFES